ncbi:TRAP transporter small permease [Plantactinospora sp. GCM10030261]|uniref:TRAP transporter small permease n=1 Tax=Plantactinospora sp. GCM10030261 TaxID=3273420 RepID=UPI00362291B2
MSEQIAERGGPLDRASRLSANALSLVSIVAVLAMMLHVLIDVTMRYVSDAPVGGTIEVVSFWYMPMIGFLSLALCQRFGQHIDIQMLVGALPARLSAAFSAMATLLGLAVVLGIGWFGWVNAQAQTAMRETALGAVSVPIWPLRYLVPLGCVAFAVQLLVELARQGRTMIRGSDDD